MTRSARWRAFIHSLRIRASNRRVIPFRFNVAQQKVWAEIAEKIDHNEPLRLIILKARREGISTLIESLLMTFVASEDLVNALVMAHMKKPANKIWNMSKLFVKSSPMLDRISMVGNGTITIGRSTLEVATAGSPESERGNDLTAVHFSEAAFYPHPEVLTATMQALPQDQSVFSIGVIESTANAMEGDGELFYEEWCRAEEGDSNWIALFLAWHEFLDYQIPGARIEQPDAEEFALRERFELSDAQLAWRRWSIRENCQGKVDKFRAEFPSFAEEAFVQSGKPFFEPNELLPFGAHLRHGTRGTVTPEGVWTPSTDGFLEMFRRPEAGHSYVVGADPSMGLVDHKGEKSHSRSAACVLDMDTLEQVAEYEWPSATHIFARHLAGIGRCYGAEGPDLSREAILAPEVQPSGGGGGREILKYLRDDYNYQNIHRWNRNVDKIRRTDPILLGWECVDPAARILMADLQWKPARQIKVGDQLIGCHEHHDGAGAENRLRVQTVVERRIFIAPMREVMLEDGRRTRVSSNHPFWIGRPNHSGRQREWRWIEARTVRPGDIVRGLQVWDTLRSYEAGRMSGLLDGEGHLSQGRRYGIHLLISQAEGLLAEEITALWGELGFSTMFKWVRHKKRPHEKPVATCGPIRFADVLHALGSLRPTRLLRKFSERVNLGRFTVRALPSAVVTSVEEIGEGPVVGLTTDPDHTLIADGILGHNTNSRTRSSMIARIRQVVMECSSVIHSRSLFKQLSAFGENDAGKTEALSGRDDLLFAYGIALMSRSENYYRMSAAPASSLLQVPDWRDYGIHVQPSEESTQALMRRLLVQSEAQDHEPSFLEL